MVPPSSIEPSTHTAGNSSQHASPSVTSDQELPHQELHLPKRRKLQDTQWSPLLPNDSEAAHLNRRVLKKLQSAFDKNPEVDLLSVFPLGYSDRLPKKIGEPVKKGRSLL